MPAAAVIPAPIAYIKVAAVKKLVVGSRVPARVECTPVVVLARVLPGAAHLSRFAGSAPRRGLVTCKSANLVPLTGCRVRSIILP